MDVPKVAVVPSIQISKTINSQASFALGKVVSSIRRGTVIAHFPRSAIIVGGNLCNYRHPAESTIEWSSGSKHFGDWGTEIGDVFFDVLRDRGVNVLGDPQDLFQQEEWARSAEYLLGARILQLKGNFCEEHDVLNGRSLKRYSGEFFVNVEWSVYSNLRKRTVLRVETQGHFEQKKSISEGIRAVFLGAFSAAEENLLAEPKFIGVLERRPNDIDTASSSQAANKTASTQKLLLPLIRPSTQSIKRQVDRVLSAVVTVRSGGGHGSGFLVGEAGLLLTNQHVVKSAQDVQVIFTNGLEVTGKVLRRDPAVDVALVQIPIRTRNVLPIRRELPRRLEDVYAVGSPMDEQLQASFTKGVVSGLRIDRVTGIRDIQADVPISGGNSGGPLLDRFGNVVGIVVSGIEDARAQNINFFIPIQDALDAIRVDIAPEKTVLKR